MNNFVFFFPSQDVKTNVPLGKRYEEHIMRIETCKEFKSRIEQDNIAIGLTSRKHDLPDLKKVKIIWLVLQTQLKLNLHMNCFDDETS